MSEELLESSGLGDAIQKIVDLTRQAAKTEVLTVKGEPDGHYYLVGPDGKAEKEVSAPAWHKEMLATPGELVKFIADRKESDSVVFYSEEAIYFCYDRDDHRDQAICPLRLSPQYLWLRDQSKTQMSQSDFVRLLRINLRGCLPADGNLLSLIKQLKFNAGSQTEGDIQHGKESLGRSITAAVTGQAAIPEEITLVLPVFENFDQFKARIACAIEIFPHEQLFRLTPYPMEIKRAMDEAMDQIMFVLEERKDGMPPAFRGQP